MAHHAYFVVGDGESGIGSARRYAERELGISDPHTTDISILRYGLFSVEDARKLTGMAYRSNDSGRKFLIAGISRLFHEAQNALLKILEEPPEGVTFILVVPSEGMFLSTLRSRLLPLPATSDTNTDRKNPAAAGIAMQFLAAAAPERKKIIDSLIARTKSDAEETKQAAREEVLAFIQELTHVAHQAFQAAKTADARREYLAFLRDLTEFVPLMYERSAPVKLICEHIALVTPTDLYSRGV